MQVKSDGNSSLGLKLEFTSTDDQRVSVLLTSWAVNHFSSNFSKVIMTREHKGFSSGWVINEGVVAMNGYTLTAIHAVCYRSDSPFNEIGWQHRSNGNDGTGLLPYQIILRFLAISQSRLLTISQICLCLLPG
ncbi:Cytosolic endo-beta-N-acetylglucosaminidase 1 [Spatholobus suberectus]|nr:Cytosolic endo-beta-N-acetylglucosaminidase 1 [Spatholobus suberectus]